MTIRQPGSNMTAVEIVSLRYDGPIPADVMMQARAEDSAFRAANPDFRPSFPPAIGEARTMVSYYASKVRSLIAAKRSCDAQGIVNSAWRASDVAMWLGQWRKERRRLAVLLRNHSTAA
jgi:hypothetical protein